jgi:hypothetical protein
MLNDEVIKALNEIFTKLKIPMKVKELFLYRPVYHELPFEGFEPINETSRLTVCDPLCIEFNYEFDGYDFAYHLECGNTKGNFTLKEKWLRSSDIYPSDAKGDMVDEVQITKKSKIDLFSSLLLRMLSLTSREQH